MSKVLKSGLFFILFIQTFFSEGQIIRKLTLDKSQHLNYAQTLIKDLKDGYLIVRLHYNQAQILYFTKIMEDKASSPKEIKMAQAELKVIISARDNFNQILTASIDSVYKFSKVRFIYDKDYSETNIDQNNASFLNVNMEMDPILGIGNAKYLVFGYMDYTTSTGRSNQDFRLLTPDFTEVPKQIQIPGSKMLFNFTFDYGKPTAVKSALIKKIANYNLRLNYFYSKFILGINPKSQKALSKSEH